MRETKEESAGEKLGETELQVDQEEATATWGDATTDP